MEIIAAVFIVGVLIDYFERQRMFPTQPCRHCDQWVRLKGGRWEHLDGSVYAEWRGIDYEAARRELPAYLQPPLHPAIPSNRPFLS